MCRVCIFIYNYCVTKPVNFALERCTFFEDAQCGVVKTPVKGLPKSMSNFGDNQFELRGFVWEDAWEICTRHYGWVGVCVWGGDWLHSAFLLLHSYSCPLGGVHIQPVFMRYQREVSSFFHFLPTYLQKGSALLWFPFKRTKLGFFALLSQKVLQSA